MADSSEAGDYEYTQWERGNIRGLGKRRRFVRTETDENGNQVKIYEVTDEEEWGPNG